MERSSEDDMGMDEASPGMESVSEATLKAVLESAGTGILVVDLQGRVIMTNTLFQDMWRIPSSLMETSDDSALLDFVCEQLEEPQAFLDRVRELYRSGEKSHDFIGFKDGRTFERFSAPLIIDGEIRGRAWSFLDVSERVRMEGEVRESLAFLQQLIDSIPNPVFFKNAEGVYTGCNRTFEEYLGIPRERILGKTVFDVTPRGLAEFFAEKDAELIESAGEQVYEAQVRYGDGSLRDVIFNEAVFHDSDGRVAGTVGVMQDITERRRVEGELERVNLELDAYASAVSHDLRNPIALIASAAATLKSLIQRVREPGAMDKALEVAEMIAEGAKAAESLTDDLLGLARAGQVPQKVASVEVRGVIDRFLAERAEEVSKRGLRIIMGEDLGRLRADPIQIYQLFGNLVGNSLRHNEGPFPELRIEYLGTRDGAHAYRLRDNGPGFPEDLLPTLFEPFSKGSRGDTGIGLAIAKKVVEAYGGEIKAFNEGGACFEFTLRDAAPPISRQLLSQAPSVTAR